MFRFISLLLITVLLLNLGFAGFAYSDTPKLTLDDAIKLAVENNPELKAAQAKLGISQADILTAAARPNPNLLSDNGIAEDTYRLGIEQTLELGGKRARRIHVAEAKTQVVSEEINQSLLDLKTKVRKAYTQLYYVQQREMAFRDIYDSTQTLLSVAQKREQAGDIPQLDVLQANIASINADNELQTISGQLTEAWNDLNTTLNTPLENRFTLELPSQSQTKLPALVDLTASAYQNRPELKQLEKTLAVTEQELKLAQANKIPNISLTVGPDLVAPSSSGKILNVFAIANVNLPIWNRQQGPIQKALATKTQLASQRQAQENTIRLEVSNAYNRFLTQRSRMQRYEADILPKSQNILDKARNSFTEGKSNIIIPINAQQTYINTKLGYLQAVLDFQNAISDLERALGSNL